MAKKHYRSLKGLKLNQKSLDYLANEYSRQKEHDKDFKPTAEKKPKVTTKIGKLFTKVLGYEHDLTRAVRIFMESRKGFRLLHSIDEMNSVTIFGSNREQLSPRMYSEATKLASLLANDNFNVVTGGGHGIMEAANKGAFNASKKDPSLKGHSVGLNINLKSEQHENPYLSKLALFHYFAIRKFCLSFSAEAYVFFPGGFGTMDEFFEIITLIQTKKIDHPVAVVVFGKEYWEPLLDWIDKTLYEKNKAIGERDKEIFKLFDNSDQAYRYISEFVLKNPNHQN